MTMTSQTYSTVVVSHNTRNMDGSPIIERTCGHKHRTLSGAFSCYSKLTRRQRDGMYRADFYHGSIRHSDGSRLTESESGALAEIECPF